MEGDEEDDEDVSGISISEAIEDLITTSNTSEAKDDILGIGLIGLDLKAKEPVLPVPNKNQQKAMVAAMEVNTDMEIDNHQPNPNVDDIFSENADKCQRAVS